MASSTLTSKSNPKRPTGRVPSHRTRTSLDLPERYRNMYIDDDGDDGTCDGEAFPQQSIYGMLAATQSKANHPSRLQQDSGSESESEREHVKTQARASEDSIKKSRVKQAERRHDRDKAAYKQPNKLAKSVMAPVKDRTDSLGQDPMTQSQFLPPREQTSPSIERPASVPTDKPFRKDSPILDRKLQAMARAAEMDARTAAASGSRKSMEEGRKQEASQSPAQVVATIFKFDEPEEVHARFSCWYLQNVLLEGDLFVTAKHVCFYCYLGTKDNTAIKAGPLSKRGKHSFTYYPYHFVLQGDMFCYYRSAAEPYSPRGLVDLRLAIAAEITDEEHGGDGTYFTVTTNDRVYEYRADTPSSAKEWVKTLRDVIFRRNNAGHSVKITILIKDIVDVEQTDLLEGAEMVKLRVMTSDDTFALDEYFFSFLEQESAAVETLKSLVQVSDDKKPDTIGEDMAQPELSSKTKAIVGSPNAKSAARHIPSSSNRNLRNSVSSNEAQRPSESPGPESMEDSTESFVTSSEHPSDSANEESVDAHMSASQMLFDDGMFQRPTLRRPQPHPVEEHEDESDDSSRAPSTDRARFQPSTRQAGDGTIEVNQDLKHRASGEPGKTASAATDPNAQLAQRSSRGSLVRGISTPITTVAGMVRSSGKAMSSYLSSSPGSYVSNWSAAMAGGKRHYTDAEGLAPDDSVRDPDQEGDVAAHEQSFRAHFALPETEKLVSVFFCWLHRTIPIWGKIYMGTRHFCFRSLWYGTKTKIVLPYKDIINAQKSRGFRWGSQGMVLVIRGHEELFFDFAEGLRDDATVLVLKAVEKAAEAIEPTTLTTEETEIADAAAAENCLLQNLKKGGCANEDVQLPGDPDNDRFAPGRVIIDEKETGTVEWKPKKPLRITCLTIGTRGDVQPYVALCKGLQAEGHRPRIATHAEFKGFVEEHGIEFAEVAGDPAVLMKLCVENGMFSPKFFIEVNSKFRGWLQELLETAWEGCQGSDVLIESPSAMCGIHIAEALQIPYFRAFTMPWTRTRAYPHAFSVPAANIKRGGNYNYMTYTFFDNIFWGMTASQVNKWRAKTLGLGPTGLDRMEQNKVPFLYNFSSHVVPPPLDFSPWIHVTGYWFLDTSKDYQPPEDLAAFIKKSKDQKRRIVYIGFGSVTVQDSKLLMQQIVAAVKDADIDCVLAKGWSDRMDKDKDQGDEVELPACVFRIKAAPHDWLFAQMDAVVHHGGAGTTGASLRAGVPTLIRPFFGDQFFFASRVDDLGVGKWLHKLTAKALSRDLWIATHDQRMRKKAAALGEAIRAQDGVKQAINALYGEMPRAMANIKKSGKKKSKLAASSTDGSEDMQVSDTEENWTFLDSSGMEVGDVEPALDKVAAAATTTDVGPADKSKGKQSAAPSSGPTKMMRGRG
ncbi:Sterol 3-beta-glucosyltransferase [Lecanosticta acicola]|uniref:sterol 3beta-glucosyltransferase n=1 Tax=Lecanosticta acicola TaxID=111012 RepID=A0AAI8Z4A1_9PEZI|nr:Sterol 3-beta-glucosyltransferase [Lecanosticta acicola]